MKLYISQPMTGKSDFEIENERSAALKEFKARNKDIDVTLIDSFKKNCKEAPLVALSRTIKMMDEADIVLFVNDWANSNGCMIEHECAVRYKIPTAYMRVDYAKSSGYISASYLTPGVSVSLGTSSVLN